MYVICIYTPRDPSCCRFELFTLLLCGFRPFFSFIYILYVCLFALLFFFTLSRLTTHYTSEYEVHVYKRRRGIHGLRGDRRPTDTHIMDQRLGSTELQEF